MTVNLVYIHKHGGVYCSNFFQTRQDTHQLSHSRSVLRSYVHLRMTMSEFDVKASHKTWFERGNIYQAAIKFLYIVECPDTRADFKDHTHKFP